VFNAARRLADGGVTGVRAAHYNLGVPALTQMAIERGEGALGVGGALMVETGQQRAVRRFRQRSHPEFPSLHPNSTPPGIVQQ